MKKQDFHLPEGMIYLDGNSLGPLPIAATKRIASTITDEWGEMLITGWNKAGWMRQPSNLGDRIAPIIGASSGSVAIGDTLSIKVYQALASALAMRPDRNVILSDTGNFPTDLYMAEGLIKHIGRPVELKTVSPDDVVNHIDETVAVVMLTEVDYRTGRMHDMKAITELTHKAGAVSMWDLAHSAGAIPVDLEGCNPEFAVGCTYKYLNAGPGAPAFIYVRPDIIDDISPALSGWLGHAAPFAFDLNYKPGLAIERMRVGTPPVLQMAALEAALDIWDDVSIHDIRKKSIELSELFIREVETRCPQLSLISPRDAQARGSQVSFAFENGYAVIQALIERGVIGDFRAPNVMRFGFTPLYLDTDDIMKAVEILDDIMKTESWNTDAFKKRSAVT
jgi:kynureninase